MVLGQIAEEQQEFRKEPVFPKLWRSHPNFFIIYFVTATVLHLGLAVTQYVDKERYTNPAFEYVYQVMPIEGWIVVSLAAFAFMTLGAYYRFHFWGRLGLSIGLFVCLSRGLLIELGPGSGGGLFVWIPLAVSHYTQLAEPQTNPLTEKR